MQFDLQLCRQISLKPKFNVHWTRFLRQGEPKKILGVKKRSVAYAVSAHIFLRHPGVKTAAT